jgi:hypothetical protein
MKPRALVVGAVLLLLTAAAPGRPRADVAPDWPSPAYDQAFWSHWGDGRAELSGYDLVIPRYREHRRGTAVLVFVTEPFSNAVRVKADPGKHPPDDEFQALKLNAVRDFPTGIYDYNVMTSTFVALQPFGGQPAGATAKVSFSAQEWCGHVYQQLLFRPRAVEQTLHSYFDGEGDQQRTLAADDRGLSEDALFLWARGLAAPVLRPGEKRGVRLLRSLQVSRFRHVPVEWEAATIERSAERSSVSVPAGTFDAEVMRAGIDGGRNWTFWVEAAAPHRILRWETSEGERGDLIKAVRLPYWKMNAIEYEKAVAELGLKARAPRMP